MNQQIRISLTDEVQGVLEYLKKNKYPILSYPEIIRVVLSQEVSKEIESTKGSEIEKSNSEPSSDELMALAQDAFYVNDKDEVEYFESDAKKPFTF
ncbi:hypothetical protein COT97_02460 [Candidatus Falkowbacteria bacterium CG10_big_fil_rev_8_21_14_0_10_39_11]|uniref:Uncharacterized protein n=1 Tax=Candidatus Falkowbacteria bacterium CG10_big_fil_rev_8_21_14_0_10_39_11 TaxID=1974565 RepID=A0A2H0V593_9BACT|nr:MAG: hypothetical protein COT97_02460 [Candidatus Falkowbacteria bacterium CG10_big_fil_rev_8_21_14_0_10_39_11]